MIRLRIREVAEAKGVSMSRLSRIADINYKTIQHIWRDPFREVSIRTIEKAAKRGLEAYAIVSRHEFITARYDQAGIYQDQLARVIGEKQANDLVCNLYIEVFEGKKS